MGEVAVAILKWTVRINFWGIMVAAWIVVSIFVIQNIVLPINGSLIADSLAMVQVWAPFNVNSIVAWLLVGSTAYLAYRTAMIAYHFVNMFISN